MDLRSYLNCWAILRSIDRHDLAAVGVYLSDREWSEFFHDPTGYMAARSDEKQEAIWSIVQGRSR